MRFVRIIVQATYGSLYDRAVVSPSPSQASAIDAAHRFSHYFPEFTHPSHSSSFQLEPGDILFKTKNSSAFGHVGILTSPTRIAENSSTAIGRIHGALGYRTPAQFGATDPHYAPIIVRLPTITPSPIPSQEQPAPAIPDTPDAPEARLVIISTINGVQKRILLGSSRLEDSSFTVEAAELMAALYLHYGRVNYRDFMKDIPAPAHTYEENNLLVEQGRYEVYVA